jgi:type III pantothenate kinase
MLLVADIGNSSVKLGLFRGGRFEPTCRVSHADLAAGAALPSFVREFRGSFVAVSVHAAGLEALERLAGKPLLVLGRDLPILVGNAYARPEEAGHDRLANAAAAHASAGGAAVAVDAGSAVTVDAVAEDGTFLGGAIAPGLPALLAGLRIAAPALPEWDGRPPEPGIPRRTIDAVRAGVLIGLAGAVDRLVELAIGAAGPAAAVVLAGGDAERLAPLLARPAAVVPHLTLDGARLLFERATGRSSCT